MAFRRMSRRRRTSKKFTPGRLVRVPYSRGQNLQTYSRGRILHVYPTDQSGNYQLACSNATPFDLTPTSGNGQLLNSIAIAGGLSGRTGTKIKMRTLLLNMECLAPVTGATVPGYHYHGKLVVFYDKRPRWGTAVTPGITDLYEASTFTSFRSLTSRDRFDVLLEKDVFLDTTSVWNGTTAISTWGPGSSRRYCVRVPINRVTSWTAGDITGGLAAMTYGALYLVYFNNNPFVSGQMATCMFNWKLSFEDLMV